MRLHPCFSILLLRMDRLGKKEAALEVWMKMAPKYSTPPKHYYHIQNMMFASGVMCFLKLWRWVCKSILLQREQDPGVFLTEQWSSQPWTPNLLQHLCGLSLGSWRQAHGVGTFWPGRRRSLWRHASQRQYSQDLTSQIRTLEPSGTESSIFK